MFIFGVVGMLAAAGDMRMIRAGALKGQSYRKALVAHVFCHVGCRRVILLWPARPGP